MRIPFLMSSSWTLTESYNDTPVGNAVSTLSSTFALTGVEITRDIISSMSRIEIDGKGYYLKRYTGGGKNLRRYIGRSRIRGEWESMLFFHEHGIPAAKVVAYGQEIQWGVMTRGALVTEEAPNTLDLRQMVRDSIPWLKDRIWMAKVIEQLAPAVRIMHSQSFIHTDLKWRNILVSQNEEPEICFIDCPAGQKVLPFFLERGIIKDLACLDKMGKQHLTRTQRLRFYRLYCGGRLKASDKVRIRKILNFFEGRE
ncbi:lipopolysaccharide kinase InaA family protein [Endozoicomonas sp. 8E]|uniref:lipopolysaccharide kinase InaA family protein n=1 Tax=Endozoicomonas sp. 8E TaxID=3035692 RepID=UPI002938E60B|nr:lipopolysaccharide kinase InaA family protein [Endozoicomonas sp. 8E]WOG28460.1 lipopolysaccharide kinase InaA family protein [Endozoicomonas sp. 8E]